MNLITSIVCTLMILFCIENKMLIGMMLVILALVALFYKRVSFKKVIIIIMPFIALPFLYELLIYFYPKFAFLNSVAKLKSYFMGRNNWNYVYGRFESLGIVLSNNSFFTNLFGMGFGASTPIERVFYMESNRTLYLPFYIREYGINHGFHLSSLSTTILDGGYVLLAFIILLFMDCLRKSLLDLNSNEKYVMGYIKLGVLFVMVFYYLYSNVLIINNSLIIIAIIMGFANIKKEDKE